MHEIYGDVRLNCVIISSYSNPNCRLNCTDTLCFIERVINNLCLASTLNYVGKYFGITLSRLQATSEIR